MILIIGAKGFVGTRLTASLLDYQCLDILGEKDEWCDIILFLNSSKLIPAVSCFSK